MKNPLRHEIRLFVKTVGCASYKRIRTEFIETRGTDANLFARAWDITVGGLDQDNLKDDDCPKWVFCINGAV